ncbi:hypothetical protein [Fusibacter ferrireducens]|uniref:Uncharacterized protein n=1 Tax=Fusibacter ferrireducens TaxID=2785058 RepID=A0ABR9ZPV3_9FIRM|nr:hypothetical protein [Fusibacter ferrireducens]MBF4692011.1 hypothetical protein [Fusibacter ferrireducens]
MKNYKLFFKIILAIVVLIVFFVFGPFSAFHNGAIVLIDDQNKIILKIEHTNQISISIPSREGIQITDPEIINQVKDLFNENALIECTDCTLDRPLYIAFYNDDREMGFLISENNLINIDGTKYKLSAAVFDEINRLYLTYKYNLTVPQN